MNNTQKKAYRIKLWKQYGRRCYYCGQRLSEETVTLDHVVPKSKGGLNRLYNFLPACFDCNLLKGNYYPEAPSLETNKRLIKNRLNSLKERQAKIAQRITIKYGRSVQRQWRIAYKKKKERLRFYSEFDGAIT